MLWDGVLWDGMLWDGVLWEGVLWEGVLWDGVLWDGVLWDGTLGVPPQDCDVELARIGSIEKRCYPMDDHLFCKDCCKRRLMEAMALWDTSSPVPHVKITPSPSPSPIPPPLVEETVQ